MSTDPMKVEPPVGLTYGEPVWDITRLYPVQGCWSEDDYLALDTNQRVEFSHGYIEFQSHLTLTHQRILASLLFSLDTFVTAERLGLVLPGGVPMRLCAGKFRIPDIIFVRAEHDFRLTERYLDCADLVMEVVIGSDRNRDRDLVDKREEYARAGIAEYWIIDPAEGRITVLVLEGLEYTEHGTFVRGERATSRLLPGFELDVAAALDAQ